MKIINDKNAGVPVGQMKDGDVAIITKWSGTYSYTGVIVQRYGDYLVSLGKPSGDGWGAFFQSTSSMLNNGQCMVQILPVGTQIEID